MSYDPYDDEMDEIEEDHLEGLHFDDPEPSCPLCELDDDRPECPDPW